MMRVYFNVCYTIIYETVYFYSLNLIDNCVHFDRARHSNEWKKKDNEKKKGHILEGTEIPIAVGDCYHSWRWRH